MWIFLNDAFYSIVEPGNSKSEKLLVRARFQDDITRNFPNAIQNYTPNRDYAYRAEIDRNEVAEVIANQINNIKYDNFKDSVEEDWRHDFYEDVWEIMYTAQFQK